jgi:hypothetical protein
VTALAVEFLSTTARRGTNRDLSLLIAAAGRGDVHIRRERRWDVYLLNGEPRPEIRGFMVRLIADGVLKVVDPNADLSLIVPARSIR